MNTKTGVYFRPQDYASLPRRFLVDVVDAACVGLLCALLLVFLVGFVPNEIILASWATVLFCYLVLLKRSRIRTLGYRIAGVRIVGLDGKPPGLLSLTLRMLFIVLGPLNYVLDLVFISSDPHKQAIRDKFAQTYVVKNNAEPAGTGRLVHRYYEILSYNFLFREVEAGGEPYARTSLAATPE